MAFDADGGQASLPALASVTGVSRRDAVITEIKRGITLGAIKPGEKLTESRLSVALGVSRPTVREALNQMAQDGLVVQEPYRGLRVAEFDTRFVLDIAHVRMALDMQAAADILADETGHRLTLVERAWSTYEREAFAADPLMRHESHLAFHRSIWEASENEFLTRLWPVTEAHITIALALDQATRHDPERAYEVHCTLIDAFRSGDIGRIRAAFVAHTIDSAIETVAIMSRGTPEA